MDRESITATLQDIAANTAAAVELATTTWQGSALFVLVSAVITGLLFELWTAKLTGVVRARPWWPNARPLQAALMKNFGYPDSAVDEEMLLESYAGVYLLSGHHFLAGLMTVPVVCLGWGSVRPLQLLFLLGGLADVSLDVYDIFKKSVQLLVPIVAPWGIIGSSRPFTGTCPLSVFIVVCCLHHPLAMIMVMPMNLHYPYLVPYHQIVCSLLLAAGICFAAGQYKFTLDTKTVGGFYAYKVIVVLQLVTILFTRGYVWFTRAHACLAHFYSSNDMPFFAAGCFCAALMSMFNVVMIMDVVQAAVKWLPRSRPQQEEENEELRGDIVKLVRSNTPSLGLSEPTEEMVKLVRSSTSRLSLLEPLNESPTKLDI